MFEGRLSILTTIDSGHGSDGSWYRSSAPRLEAARAHRLAAGQPCLDAGHRPWLDVFHLDGSIAMIWPMFGVANQPTGLRGARRWHHCDHQQRIEKYAWVTFVPACFVSTTTLTAGYMSVRDNFWPMAIGPNPALHTRATSSQSAPVIMLVCAVIILFATARRCLGVLSGQLPTFEVSEA